MSREMGAVNWLEWKVFLTLQPAAMSEERADIRAAIVAMSTWNVQVAKAQGAWDASKRKKGRRPEFRPLHDFLQPWGDADLKPKPKKLTGEEQMGRLVDMVQSWGMQPVKR